MDEDDTDRPLAPPGAQEVAARILCLAGAMADVSTDLEQGRTDPQEVDEFLAKLHRWRQTEGSTELYSSLERNLIDRHPSTWTLQEVLNATWRQESIGTLLWMERHFALNWLCGYSEDWDETPTDT